MILRPFLALLLSMTFAACKTAPQSKAKASTEKDTPIAQPAFDTYLQTLVNFL